jgi:hypothetical protein
MVGNKEMSDKIWYLSLGFGEGDIKKWTLTLDMCGM